MAEGVGFEPTDHEGLRFSRPVHSTRLCDPSMAPKLYFISLALIHAFGGAGEIRTLAPFTRPNALAGRPLIASWVLLHKNKIIVHFNYLL